MPRATASLTIAFGSVQIPVRLYGATDELKVGFSQVHATDKGRIRYKKVCEACGSDVASDAILKGYEIGGQMITFSEDELDALRPANSKHMLIAGFIGASEIPVVALDKSVYVGTESPKKGGVGAPFVLLRDAMREKKVVAIVQWVSRSSEQLGVLIPYGSGFLLKHMLYAEQVRPMDAIEVMETMVSPKHLEKAQALIGKMMLKPFDHSAYRESYSATIRQIIEAKAMGEDVKVETVAKQTEASSLDDALDASLA